MFNRFISQSLMLTCFLLAFQACTRDHDMTPSDKFRSSIPENVELLDHTSNSVTISWDLVPGATSYVVQLLAAPTDEMPLYTHIAKQQEEYYEFGGLESRQSYYARVRANFPNSAVSNWNYLNYQDEVARIIPKYGVVESSFEIPYFKIIETTSSTITAEWSFTGFDDSDSEIGDAYTLELYDDAQGNDLHISWELQGLFAPSTASTPKPLRFTFSGLPASTDYYLKVKNTTKQMESGLKKVSTLAAVPQASASPAQSGDVVLSQDFSNFIHGGDIFRKASGYTVSTAAGRSSLVRAAGENPVNSTLGQGPCDVNTEFNVFDGGNVTREYTKAAGMENWGKKGNTSTRPGYIKIGGSKAEAALYTPLLNNLPSAKNIVVKFKAGVYMEGQNSFCDRILVQAVEDAAFDAKGAITNAGSVNVVQSTSVNISASQENFGEYTVTFNNVSPNTRIVFSSDPADVSANKTRFLLDDVVVVVQ